MKKWSDEVWQLAEPVYNQILDLPFITELAAGTLSHERFLFYIMQDSIYIENYARVLAHVASRLPRTEQLAEFVRFALDGVAMERELHSSYLGDVSRDHAAASPTCLLYNSYESAMGLRPVEVEAAVVLPCFWVYQKVGRHIISRSAPDNPYAKWISAYADDYMEQATARAIAVVNDLADNASPQVRAEMTEAFLNATRMEWMFWHSAYNLEQWSV